MPIPGGTGLVYFSNDVLGVSGLEGDTSFHQVINEIRTDVVHSFDVSRDGRWLVYDSGLLGGNQVYVTSFPSAGGNWQISRDGGIWPLWSPSGDEVVYYRGDVNYGRGLGSVAWFEQGRDFWLSSIHVSTRNGQVTASHAEDLFKMPPGLIVRGFHPDGKRFLALKRLPPQFTGDRMVAILNWADQITTVH